jgi:DNA-directed RNA polymerase subunit RPC12/RpoP
MEVTDKNDYSIFSALVETMHKKDRNKLRFAKCNECGRVTPFRLISVASSIKCKKCGTRIFLNSNY